MPVTISLALVHRLSKINVDMVAGTIYCYFDRTLNGAPDGGAEVWISGADMSTLLKTQATTGQPLGDEIADALYDYALAKGTISGVLS